MKRVLTLIAAALLGLSSVSRAALIGDFNHDGRVSIMDVITLLQIISGRTPAGDVGKEYVLASAVPGPSVDSVATSIQGIQLVDIPADSFYMGSTLNGMMFMHSMMHRVTLDQFWMSRTEITQGQFRSVMGTDPAYFTGNDSLPVENLSWYDAVRFCNQLSLQAGLTPCYDLGTWQADFSRNGFRLPSEAEWEYGCRAGSQMMYYNGDTESALGMAAWYFNNGGNQTHPVGEKAPNAWGLYDMSGNVWEWCNDWYDDNYYSASPGIDPSGPQSGTQRVMRGGGWNSLSSYCASGARFAQTPDKTDQAVGFRVVRRQ